MGDKHLNTILATKSDEVIKSSVENLISIPSESEGIPDNMCDVPFHDNSPPLDILKDQFEDFFDSNDDSTSIDDDSFSIDDIKYVEASPPNSELISLEVMEIVIPKVGGIDEDILLTIKDDILCEKLLNINLLIANIKALKDNPTSYADFMTKSSSTSLNFLLEVTNTFDNSLPKSKTFCFDSEVNSSRSTTTRADISLPDYEDDHVKEINSGSTTTYSDFSLYDSFIFELSINPFPTTDRSDFYDFADELAHIISLPKYDCFSFKNEPNSGDFTMDLVEDTFPTREPRVHVPNVLPTHPTLQLNQYFILYSKSLFAYVVWIFLPFLSYSVAPQYLLSFWNEDTIFDPEISICHSFMLDVSHRTSLAIVEPLRIELPFLENQFQEDPLEDQPEVPMADNRTMAELLQAPTEGYEDAIVIPKIAANNFELKHARIWLEKESPRSILTWDDLVTKFINQACPHHEFSELHQLDTFYNALNVNDQDSLNSAAGGNFLDKMPQEYLKIIESKSKVCQSRAKAVVDKVSTSSFTLTISSEVSELKDMVRALLLDKKNQSSAPTSSSTPAPVKAVELNYVTCGGTHSYQNCPATSENVYRDNIQEYVSQAAAANYNQGNTRSRTLPSNTITNPKEDLKGITTRSGVAYQGPTIPTPSKVVKQGTEPVVAPVSVPMPNLKSSIPYPSRRDPERRRDQANEQIEKFYEIFKDMSFEISFTDALILMLKFASTLKALIGNKEKLSEMARTQMNEHCSAIILNKLLRKLGDPDKFIIPCEFPGMDECLALADLGASINLMTLSVWEGLSLLELTSTCMTLELADHSVSKPIGIAKDVSVKVGVFHFPTDFVVVDFEPDPRVLLILERCFLKIGRALIDVHKGELTLCIKNDAITYNLDQTVRYSANYNQMTANKIDVICEENSQEVLGFSDVTASGNPTPYDDSIVSTTSSTLTSFGDSDFLLFEEADAFLAILNSKPLTPLPNQEKYLPSFKKELKVCEAKTVKSSVDEPPEVELKDIPPHLKYAFLEGDNKFPVIIAKELRDEEKSDLMKVLKSHKRAIAWKLSDIQGINPESCTHKILMEEDYKPVVQHQRRVNPNIHDVIKKEVKKLLDAGLIYSISDSPWVSPVHCVPKKGGFIVVENEENELIPTCMVAGWRVCINYRKLNEATRKDHFPLPFMDQMLERLAWNEYYCFLDGFFGYFQIPIDPRDQEKTTFTYPYRTFAYRRMPFGLCNAPGTFHRCMLAIFHDMVEKTMEVFMDDFLVFGNSFENCLSRLDKMLQRCEATNLCLNWEKSHFMVKEGIVLGRKISKNGIEVDKAKVDFIAKLPHPTTVK
nr:reverse transcriptase domain-containing protein [Tanacetum cinerariifolium]